MTREPLQNLTPGQRKAIAEVGARFFLAHVGELPEGKFQEGFLAVLASLPEVTGDELLDEIELILAETGDLEVPALNHGRAPSADPEASRNDLVAAQAQFRRLMTAWLALWPEELPGQQAVRGILRDLEELCRRHRAQAGEWWEQWIEAHPELLEGDSHPHPAQRRLWDLLDLQADQDERGQAEILDLFAQYPTLADGWFQRWRRMRQLGPQGHAGQLVGRGRDSS